MALLLSAASSTKSSIWPGSTGRLSVSVAALDSLRKSWADVARLAGHDRAVGDTNIQLNVNSGPTINIIVDRLLAIVEDLPEVRARMATALLEIGGLPASSSSAGRDERGNDEAAGS